MARLAALRPFSSRPIRAVALALLVGAAACADAPEPPAPGWSGSVDTLPNGAVRVRNPAEGLWDAGEGWSLEEDLRIGALQGDGPELFGRVQDVVPGPGGTVYVVEGQAQEIRVFGPDGAWRHTLGTRGQGPGEFAFAANAFWSPDDRLWVYDIQNSRFSVFDTTGAHLDDHPFTTLGFYPQHAFGADGTLYVAVGVQEDQGEIRSYVVPSRVAADGLHPLDTFPVPNMGGVDRFTVVRQQGGRAFQMRLPLPFQGTPTWFVDPEGYLWTGDPGEGYRLIARTLEGDTLRLIEREHEPVPVTDHEADSVMADMRERFTRVELERTRLPSTRAAFQTFHRTPGGVFWVQRFDAPGSVVWEVFDAGGRYLGPVDMPDGPRPNIRHVGDSAVYATVTGELDETYVVRYRIRKGG